MSYRIPRKPITQVRPLVKIDPSGEATVTIRQATTGDMRSLGELFATTEQVYNDSEIGVTRLKRELNMEDLKMQRVSYTLVSTNLVDEDGEPFFKFPLVESVFQDAWDALPPEVAEAIYEEVVAVNPKWDPKRQGE